MPVGVTGGLSDDLLATSLYNLVLYDPIKEPFEHVKHLTLKAAFLLALAFAKCSSEIYTWVRKKLFNLGQWEKIAAVIICSFFLSFPNHKRPTKIARPDGKLNCSLQKLRLIEIFKFSVPANKNSKDKKDKADKSEKGDKLVDLSLLSDILTLTSRIL